MAHPTNHPTATVTNCRGAYLLKSRERCAIPISP